MDSIPDHCAYNVLREEVRRSWNNTLYRVFDFFILADAILEINIDVQQCQAATQPHFKPQTIQKNNFSLTDYVFLILRVIDGYYSAKDELNERIEG